MLCTHKLCCGEYANRKILATAKKYIAINQTWRQIETQNLLHIYTIENYAQFPATVFCINGNPFH